MKSQSYLEFPELALAAKAAAAEQAYLDAFLKKEVPGYASEDTSFVVFGSLARGEWTSGSDLDWTLLVDGQANSDHLVIAQEITRALDKEKARWGLPGQTGTFGNLAFSHDIIHQIGGQNDTNKNTTQRILLLLESAPIGTELQAYERVLRGVVNRYVEEDNHLVTSDGKRYRVPRFLLNDIVRFWRTMAVDFASKQRDRGGEGWGLRNAKLRISRKLIFASGLLMCFSCYLDPELQALISTDKNVIKLNLVKHIRDYVRLTPLETVARSMLQLKVPQDIVDEFFGSYARFLCLLDDPKKRAALQTLRATDSRSDPTFQFVRDIGRSFEHALDRLFFDTPEIANLTRKYAVF